MTDIVERLQELAEYVDQQPPVQYEQAAAMTMREAADEIERLREKCDKQAMILRRLNPENFPGSYFICGEAGEKDQNGMPGKIMVAPAYGVDFAYEYVYNGEVRGPEW